jgi:hypothetical protein
MNDMLSKFFSVHYLDNYFYNGTASETTPTSHTHNVAAAAASGGFQACMPSTY